jgi:uncharacterized membrane protein HdeD (DUF308 family)
MSANAEEPAHVSMTAEASGLRRNWGWFLATGIIQIIAASVAVGFILSTTHAAFVIVGAVLVIAGTTQTALALLARDWDGFYLFLLLAFLYTGGGILALQNPGSMAEGLRLLLAAVFLLVGLFRIAAAIVSNVPGRRWVLINGLVALLLGLCIWRKWPGSDFRALGMLVGTELIVNGVTWSALAVEGRRGFGRTAGQ